MSVIGLDWIVQMKIYQTNDHVKSKSHFLSFAVVVHSHIIGVWRRNEIDEDDLRPQFKQITILNICLSRIETCLFTIDDTVTKKNWSITFD